MALAPWRQAILPVIVMKPIWATAITAMVVATDPSIVPCSQFAALTKTPEPGGLIDAAALAGSQIRAIAIATGPTPKLIG